MAAINSVLRPAVEASIAFSLSTEFDNRILGIKFKNVYISRYVGIGAQIVLRDFVIIFCNIISSAFQNLVHLVHTNVTCAETTAPSAL